MVSKSERLRELEMQVLVLEFRLEQMSLILETLLDSQNLNAPTLDAGKWYNRKLGREND
jgi:hypothetical protein